jgi:hypothetical protein
LEDAVMPEVQAHSDTRIADYERALARWKEYAGPGIRTDDAGRWYFGDPSSLENGIRSASNFAVVSAYHARAGDADCLEWTKKIISYLGRSHVTGDSTCIDGNKWGRVWQSSWWSAKLGLAAHLAWDKLDELSRVLARTVLADEANHLLTRTPTTGLTWDTKAEENAWDTEALAVALLLMPGHENAARWREQLNAFAMNTLSRAVDQESAEVVEGKAVRDWNCSVNLFHDFTLENHGSCHFCYVASPLVSLTVARLAHQLANTAPPTTLLHNVRSFWNRHKPLFMDRSFAYVGGQDWARYTYGQYFVVPACAMLQEAIGDGDAALIESLRLSQLLEEQSTNRDGGFFSARVTQSQYTGQKVKYETDCYAQLVLAKLIHERNPQRVAPTPLASFRQNQTAVHIAREAHVAWARSPDLLFSFCAQALESKKPLILFSPTGHESLTEWMPGNLCGNIEYTDRGVCPRLLSMLQRDGKLLIDCTFLQKQGNSSAIEQKLSIAFNPAQSTLRLTCSATAKRKLWITECFGLNFAVANDRFNAGVRTYNNHQLASFTGDRTKVDKAFKRLNLTPRFRQRIVELNSDTVTIDSALRIHTPGQPIWVRQSPDQHAVQSLRYDLLGCGPYRTNFQAREGETLLDFTAELSLVK